MTRDVMKWLQEVRKLDGALLADMGVSKVDHPALGEAVSFPYRRNGKPYAGKFRRPEPKEWRSSQGVSRGLYNEDALRYGEGPIVITEGECLSGDTEVLTPSGWIPLEDYRSGQVAQWSDGAIEWVVPLARIEKPFDGEMIHFSDRFVSMMVTPGHRMPGISQRGKLKFKTAAEREQGFCKHHALPRSGVLYGGGIGLSRDQIAFCLAISADATIDVRLQSYAGGPARIMGSESRYARVSFKKQRKISRFASILESLGIEHCRSVQPSSPENVFFGVPMPDWVPGRFLPWDWVANASRDEREFILQELKEWDGNVVPNRRQHEFSTKHIENAEWLQAMCHTSGVCSTIMRRSNEYGSWFKVSILHGKSSGTYQQLKGRRVHGFRRAYCLTVPSGAIIARHDERVFVTGNCDTLSVIQSGFGRCVSLPDGWTEDNGKRECLVEAEDLFRKSPYVIVAGDNDSAGRGLPKTVANILAGHDVRRAEWPEGCKDANDTLMMFGEGEVARCLTEAVSIDPEGGFITGFSDIPALPDRRVLRMGMTPYDYVAAFEVGAMSVGTGTPGSGKSTFTTFAAYHVAKNEDIRVGVLAFETHPYKIRDHIARLHMGRPWDSLSKHERREVEKWADRHFRLVHRTYETDSGHTLGWLKGMIYTLAVRDGCKMIIVDPWNELEHLPEPGESMTGYINFALQQIRVWAEQFDTHICVVAHPRKMPTDGIIRSPTGYDVADSAAFANKPSLGFTVHQEHDEDGSPFVRVSAWKVRDTQLYGFEKGSIRLTFHQEAMTYTKYETLSVKVKKIGASA